MLMRMEYPTHLRWYAYSHVWEAAQRISGSAVGPLMISSYEHLLCEDFARCHPDSATFLLEKLADPDPYLAGYAFKCLIRVKPDLRLEDMPAAALARTEEVAVLPAGCVVQRMKLGDFLGGYFGVGGDEDIEETDA